MIEIVRMTQDSDVVKTAIVKNLFDDSLVRDTKQRVMKLHLHSRRQWGSMTVRQALAHCTAGLEMAMGAINPKRAPLPASIIGLLIKPIVFGNDKPLRRNSPSSPELFGPEQNDYEFERERTDLVAAIDRFSNEGPGRCSRHPHPFFGRLKPHQWAILMYKHIDHHLRQFGV